RLSGGYQFDFVGFDFRITLGSTQFGEIFPTSGVEEQATAPPGLESASDPNAELQRGRTFKDSWDYLLFEPGVILRAKLFAWDKLPLLSQIMRFGIGYGPFSDNVNSLSFSGLLVYTSAGLEYRLGPNSPWSASGGLEYAWGRVNRSDI